VFVVPLLFAATSFTGSNRHTTELPQHADENEDVVAAINRLRCARRAPETSLAEIVARSGTGQAGAGGLTDIARPVAA
jgi:hypothetical protein